MKINRLFEIVYILLEKKVVTANELASYFGVSIRTIYRDIDILSTSNIPIYTNKGKGGGISLLDNFVLDKSLLSEEDQNQILFALQSLEKINGNSGNNRVLEKISNIFNKNTVNWIEVDFSNWDNNSSKNYTFNIIKEAILNKRVIEITYFNSNGEDTKRKIEPLQVCFKDKSWYVKAYCRLKSDYRIFKISRIEEAKILDENFDRIYLKEQKGNINFETVTLELVISKTMSYRVYDEFEKESVSKNKDGDFIVKVEFPKTDWIYGYIMSFGEYIRVNSPEYVKNIIREKLEKSLKNFL